MKDRRAETDKGRERRGGCQDFWRKSDRAVECRGDKSEPDMTA